MSKVYKYKKLVVLLLISFWILLNAGVYAQGYDSPEGFLKEMITKIMMKDKQGVISLILNNPDTAKKTFRMGINHIEKQLAQGVTVDNRELRALDIMCQVIAMVFKNRLKDNSLYNEYVGFSQRIKTKYYPPSSSDIANPPLLKKKSKIKSPIDQEIENLEYQLLHGKFQGLPKTMKRVKELKEKFTKDKDYPRLIKLMEMFARFLDNLGVYANSIEAREKILKIAHLKKEPNRLIRSYLRLANSCINNEDYKNAIKYLEKADKIVKKIDSNTSKFAKITIDLNLTYIYIVLGNKEKARHYWEMLDKDADEMDSISPTFSYEPQDFYVFLNSLDRLGRTFRKMGSLEARRGNKEKAKSHYLKMLAVYIGLLKKVQNPNFFLCQNKIDRMRSMISSLQGIISIKVDLKEFQEAYKYNKLILKIISLIPKEKMVL